LRGSPWADGAEAVTVTFRTSRPIDDRGYLTPNIRFRVCRQVVAGD
jgi:hypothetical protein